MNEIRLYLDYKCFPIWIYDETGTLIENDLPNELKNNIDLDKKLVNLQEEYDSLFTDSNTTFSYNGFIDKVKKQEFVNQFDKIQQKLEGELTGKYKVVNKIRV